MSEDKLPLSAEKWSVGTGAWLALILAILFFSGLFFNVEGMAWLGAFDFTTLGGSFGTMKDPAHNTFVGAGGLDIFQGGVVWQDVHAQAALGQAVRGHRLHA